MSWRYGHDVHAGLAAKPLKGLPAVAAMLTGKLSGPAVCQSGESGHVGDGVCGPQYLRTPWQNEVPGSAKHSAVGLGLGLGVGDGVGVEVIGLADGEGVGVGVGGSVVGSATPSQAPVRSAANVAPSADTETVN